MKNRKFEVVVKLTGVASVVIALIATFAPVSSRATEPGTSNKQWVETSCPIGNGQFVPCNNCDPGTKNCNDNTCTQCRGQG